MHLNFKSHNKRTSIFCFIRFNKKLAFLLVIQRTKLRLCPAKNIFETQRKNLLEHPSIVVNTASYARTIYKSFA